METLNDLGNLLKDKAIVELMDEMISQQKDNLYFENKLDPAFERRFLYKIKLDTPGVNVRTQIIADRIPVLSPEQARHLASNYALSGGQLDNVARKMLTAKLIGGQYPTPFREIEGFFRDEKFTTKTERSVVGFQHTKENLTNG